MNTVKNKCERKNMCHDEPCGENAKCIPRGTDNFECKCRWGYEGDGFNFVNKNECLEAPCHMVHVMTMPSVRIPLAVINAHVKMDILDWKTRTMFRCRKCAVESPCADNAACINIEGSFQCRCPSSYIIADDGVNCIDDDECRYTGMCHSNADCTNTDGLYECCPDGFFGDGN